MNLTTLESSNPALRNEEAFGAHLLRDDRANVATMSGVIAKTAFLVSLALVSGIGGAVFFGNHPGWLWVGSIAALVVTLGVGFAMAGKPALAPILAPIYAVVEGAFLGGVTQIVQTMLTRMEVQVPGGVALQALVITGGVMAAMLVLYRAGVIKPTNTFVAVVSAATLGIMLTYVASFVLGFFFQIDLPFVSFGSIFATGTAGWIGLGVNVLILLVASLWLVVDFRRIDELVSSGSPKSAEWYGGFCLLVSLAWIYYEAVKLVARLAIMFGNRD